MKIMKVYEITVDGTSIDNEDTKSDKFRAYSLRNMFVAENDVKAIKAAKDLFKSQFTDVMIKELKELGSCYTN